MINSFLGTFSSLYIDPPYNLIGWLGIVFLSGVLLLVNWRWREKARSRIRQRWLIILVLIVAAPLLATLFPIRFPLDNVLPIPGLPTEPHLPVLFVLAALPMVLAAGILEPVWAGVVGGLTGLAIGFVETHHIFTVFEYAGLATLYSLAVRQRYRTWFFGFLRNPLGAAAFIAIIYAPIYILTSFLASNGMFVARLDYAITQTWPVMLSRGSELLIASLVAELFYLLKSPLWGKTGLLAPSPLETSLQLRFFVGTAPLIILLLLTLTIGDWLVAGKAARDMLQSRMSTTARLVADSLPYFFEAGQNLLVRQNDAHLFSVSTDTARQLLNQNINAEPYFQQFFLFDAQKDFLTGYPTDNLTEAPLTDQETAGIELAIKGVMVQNYTIPNEVGSDTIQISFEAPIRDDQKQVVGVILGRTDFRSNPFTQSAIQALNAMSESGGDGYIIDEDGHIIYNANSKLLMDYYQDIGRIPDQAMFFDEFTGFGTRRMVYYQPLIGQGWGVVLSVPAEQAQTMALNIALPLLAILVVLAAGAYIALRVSLRSVASSMHTLSHEATLISQGQLDHALQVNRVDEVGQVGRAFDQMRLSLKARLEELSRLLRVSQGVAANLETGDAMRPVLEAAMGEDAAMARVVLQPEIVQDLQSNQGVIFGVGPAADQYSYLDAQIFDLMRTQEVLSITNTGRVRRVLFKPGVPQPGALVALALHHEERYLGAIWVAYDQARNFTEEEIRFLGTLAGQAAIAASNASLFASAEVGRQRLEAVLVSTPEPVVVFDKDSRLLLLNAAAIQVPGLIASPAPGLSVKEVVAPQELAEIIAQRQTEKLITHEITLNNGHTYFASISPVNSEGRQVGKVCVLQDITHFKELDSLKSDFVATVSHDLRAPLTYMRGYVTMLQMVGELNEQQQSYSQKIISGIENMSRLVTNLLDLGRIDAGIGLQIERVMAQDVVERVLSSIQPQATQKSIQLSQQGLDQPPIYVEADRALLEQAITNLVENAVKYTPTNGKVRVRIATQANNLIVEVQDNGIGIAPLDLPRLFERFYRSTRREANSQRGTGLGLAIVKSVAERHGGRVWVESQLGKGSVFTMEIPLSTKKVEILKQN